MIVLPNPFESALASETMADTAAAPDLTDPPVAVAVLIAESSMTEGGYQEAPAAPPNSMVAGATDDICEIFHHVRLLIAEDKAVHSRFVLNEREFMDAIEEPPLFLRHAGFLR